MAVIVSNYPYINENSFRNFVRGQEPAMTASGVVRKTFFLLALLAGGAAVGACFPRHGQEARTLLPIVAADPGSVNTGSGSLVWPGALALLLGMIFFAASFMDRAQIYLAQAFAFFQGMAMASFAAAVNSHTPGVAAVAFLITFLMLAGLLLGYQQGWIPDFEEWSAGIGAFFITIIAIYLGIFILRVFGADMPFPQQTTVVYWAFVSGFMVFLAFQLSNSFRYIDDAVEMGAPKWMEWRAAFGLMVALISIYYDVLRILARASRRRSD